MPKPMRLLTMLKHMLFRFDVTFSFNDNEEYIIRLRDKKDNEFSEFRDEKFAIVVNDGYKKLKEVIK